MSDITFMTLIVPDADVALAREIAAAVDAGGAGMWTTPLSPTGAEPATAWISTGYVPANWAQMIPVSTYGQDEDGAWVLESRTDGDAVAVQGACAAAGVDVPLADVEALYAVVDVTAQDPWVALARLGLQMVQPVDPPVVEDTP